VFICPVCNNEWTTKLTDVKTGRVKSCFNCIAGKIKDNSHAKNITYKNTIRSAKVRGYEFNIKKNDYFKLIEKHCHYCGAPPNQTTKPKKKLKNGKISYYKEYIHHGLDRVDNNIGYILYNVVTCCKVCNRGKNNMAYDEFIKYINELVKYNRATQ
jgi:hypothetical protein